MKLTKNQEAIIRALGLWHKMGGGSVRTSHIMQFTHQRMHRKTLERNLRKLTDAGIVEHDRVHYRSNVMMNMWSLSGEIKIDREVLK